MSKPRIPRRLVFTYKTNLLETKIPPLLYDNVMESISRYKNKIPNGFKVDFLDDADCRAAVQRTEPALVPYFDAEKHGMYKADICRVATLYEHGGYYMDIDLQVADPPTFDAPVNFATVREPAEGYHVPGFFQAFLATTPGHPVLRTALYTMLEYYNGTRTLQGDMGTSTLKDAYDIVRPRPDSVALMQESRLVPSKHNVPRQEGEGCCCNYVVHDEHDHVHFYSRIVGSNLCTLRRDSG